MKKIYVAPFVEKVEFTFNDKVLSSTVEEFKSYIDGPGDWGDDPIFDEDDIIWWGVFIWKEL